ncbi:hypothetical protein [Cerasicoccus arenae]|uniref:Uncharacterized protein n=1 Tax=Cerasicoccus arenae TaxID=424488 RepID=A0A8J3DJL3_9BACT|nr:hypothetical protein [Cerasicoccus arenae]MBK1858757.1 hypothetical protein [Cerasicoccus arenae]GHC07310.1 hypothetical protein GCM10007047_25530 [Cerasicoccus arenae]
MYVFSASDKRGQLPEVQVGRRAMIMVDGANKEKGIMTVYVEFSYE